MGSPESLFDRLKGQLGLGKARVLPSIKPITQEQLGQRLDEVLMLEPQNHRLGTYGQSLYQIPSSDICNISNILEVGINGTIYLFSDFFAKGARYFGLTLNPEHLDQAQTHSLPVGSKRDIRLRDLKEGLPTEWNNMDLAMDIYSASHYLDPDETIRHLAGSLRPGGYCMVVAGGDMVGSLAEFFRKYPEKYPDFSAGPVPRWLFNRELDPTLQVLTDPADRLEDKISDIGKDLQETGFILPEAPTGDDIVSCIEGVADIMQASVVSSFDMLFMQKFNTMRNAGLSNVRRFQTNDGTGIIGKKT